MKVSDYWLTLIGREVKTQLGYGVLVGRVGPRMLVDLGPLGEDAGKVLELYSFEPSDVILIDEEVKVADESSAV